jgi:hypothetical protein
MSFSSGNYSGSGKAANGIARLTRDRAQKVWHAGQERTQQNPIPIVLGALAIGVVVGLLCGRREPKPRDARQLARDFLEDAAGRLAHRLHLESAPGQLCDRFASLGRKWHGGRFW